MKFYITSVFFLCFAFATMAQVNDFQRGFKINPVDSTSQVDLKLSFKLSPIKGLTNKNIKYTLNYNPLPALNKEKHTVDMSKKSTLVDKQWDIKQQFNENTLLPSEYRKDQDLGYIRTKSKYLILTFRDFGVIDGDRVKIWHNQAVLLGSLTIDASFYAIRVDLDEGLNELSVEALNNGLAGINTAEFNVYDDQKNLLASRNWYIAAHYKARLIVIKEK